ncbi:uncharacterized protein LOC110457956 [Mizuhopecten yessoensis]|uniref:uncharacterized protein LOC110457956 n=1 Tax=Mizuhopecten yessoensis TaxID=6573 RepID=UPI000B4590D9|nr:uncharacterized protein LOC110457956 [Mizuhopecten yessoensis]
MAVNQAKIARSQLKLRKGNIPRPRTEGAGNRQFEVGSNDDQCLSNGTGFSTYATSKNFRVLSTTSSIYASIRSGNRRKDTGAQQKPDIHDIGAQYPPKPLSIMTTDTGISLDGYPANNCIGYKTQLCQTESEFKAQKLNRTEECKLENYKSRVQREQRSREKQWTQSTHSFRAKSARVFDRLTPKSNPARDVAYEKPKNQRPKSSPAYVSFFQKRPKDPKEEGEDEARRRRERTCSTCEYMKKLIQMYEDHIGELESEDGAPYPGDHSRYSFSDRQVKTFMHLLETEYCSEIPKMRELLHSGGTDGDKSTTASNGFLCSAHDNGIQSRISRFCRSQESFNKKHPLPEYIKKGLENVRISQAMLAKQQHVENRRAIIIQEARRKLGIIRL